MNIKKYVAYRLLSSLFVLFGLSLLIFTLSRLVPGDPARLALGPMAPQWAVDRLREQLHLNEPIYMHYFYWVSNVLKGDLGQSLVTRRGVFSDILEFFPATFELVMFSVIISSSLAIILGVTAGKYANSWWDNIVRVTSYVGIAIPSFVWAILSVFIFGYLLRWFPTLGRLSACGDPSEGDRAVDVGLPFSREIGRLHRRLLSHDSARFLAGLGTAVPGGQDNQG
jgi:peptide/nickel transport system permease protein